MKPKPRSSFSSRRSSAWVLPLETVGWRSKFFRMCNFSVNFLFLLLKKNWQNVRCLYLKSTMGKPYSVLKSFASFSHLCGLGEW
ncbi:hypothetical protein AAC387_Pa01g3350 [Persea americana]